MILILGAWLVRKLSSGAMERTFIFFSNWGVMLTNTAIIASILASQYPEGGPLEWDYKTLANIFNAAA